MKHWLIIAALVLSPAWANAKTVNLGEPFGNVTLVDEVDVSRTTHELRESRPGVSQVKTLLGKPHRVLNKTVGEGAYFSYRLGAGKNLKPGAAYLLTIDYPEDVPRTVIVSNTGNETIRGFHTGTTVGDSFHPKYVANHNESLNVPLSGKTETWTHLFRLHDRFTEPNALPRGDKPRPITAKDGFFVSIIQYSARNIPMSHGAAVSSIRLYEVTNPEQLDAHINYPPEELPKRRLFWREEMADGVVAGKTEDKRGLKNWLDWYRFKAERMQFLGMNTFSKDLLEFGANQGWDSRPHGGHDWVYYGDDFKHRWDEICEVMGEFNYDVLPYYEYSGSKGKNGLGFQRRARPLNRKDGYYGHIKWVEKANADITDPDTYEDFKKMLDLTVIRQQNKVNFAGIWLRPRAQMPMSFADATIARYNNDRNANANRQVLLNDKTAYQDYVTWWEHKRRDFFVAMREYLIANGVENPQVLYTGDPSEPGQGLPGGHTLATDNPDMWAPILAKPTHLSKHKRRFNTVTPGTVAQQDHYLKHMLSPGSEWGGYEQRHLRPADDPQHYKTVDNISITHGFNRSYTVNNPKTFDAYRAKQNLTIVRHYTLNENMMFDKQDKNIMGYFVNDMERAGAACMMAEALAMANGDPTQIGYLSGGNFGRGFPKYVRDFNQAFLSLPALPSKRVTKASSDKDVVVRAIKTDKHGTWYAVVNTSWDAKQNVSVTIDQGKVSNAATGKSVAATNGTLSLSLYPYQLVTYRVQ